MGLENIFDDNDINIDQLDIVDIDIDGIGVAANNEADDLINNLAVFYYDEQFMSSHPTFKKQVDADLESLRILFKMRKSDEITHDLLVNAISKNPGNASLYKSLTDVQKTIISITTKIGDIIKGLNTLMKGYQLELNFEEKNEPQEQSEGNKINNTHRGTKEFINQISAEEQSELLLDEENEGESDEVII
jgi:hypothetical protein